MANCDVWNMWHESLQSPQNPTATQESFVATRGLEGYVFHLSRQVHLEKVRQHGTKLLLHYIYKANNDGNRWQKSTVEQEYAWLFTGSDSTPNFDI